ncbi:MULTISPECIES: DUF1146 family protein [Paenibacillus]|uniref:DUF1146 family protein n=1 Tax=Paenibacillus TaxID=44249 RepID=UPI0003819189|nr:DUF1146 family protein [Paenibacillus massiliensis]
MSDELTRQLSQAASANGLISMLISLLCIGLSWWALQNFKLDLLIRHPKGPQGRLLHLLFAIVLGRFVAGFILDYMSWSQMLRHLF